MVQLRLGRSAQITWLAAGLMAGVFLGRLGIRVLIWVPIVASVITGTHLIRRSRMAFASLMIAVVTFGVWRGWSTALPNTYGGQHISQKVTIVGEVIDDPGRNDKNQIVFTLGSGQIEGHSLGYNVRVSTFGGSFRRGYKVAASGTLRESLGASPVQISFAEVEVLSDKTSWLEGVRARFFSGARTLMPDPMSGFGIGLLVGVRSLIDKPLQDTLSMVGLSHLVAVSGYNLTIIIQAMARIFGRFSLFMTTALSMWLIFAFLLVAGFSASIVRAALVSSLGLLAAYYGFEAKPMTLIALPGFITVAMNPNYLINDLGWQLSFLAFFGILVMAPAIEARFVKHPNALKSLFIESTAAHIITLPLIMLRFGAMSVVAPISNVVILPLVPLAMLLSFISAICGIMAPAWMGWLSLPATGILALMVGLSQWFATWPFASINLPISNFLTAFAYSLIIGVTWVIIRSNNRHQKSL